MFISCGSNSVLTSFSKRKYLPKFPKQKPIEKHTNDMNNIQLLTSNSSDLIVPNYSKTEVKIINEVVTKKKKTPQQLEIKNKNSSIFNHDIKPSLELKTSNQKNNYIKATDKDNLGGIIKLITLLVLSFLLIGLIFFAIEAAIASKYLTFAFIIGAFSIALAIILLFVLILLLIVYAIM